MSEYDDHIARLEKAAAAAEKEYKLTLSPEHLTLFEENASFHSHAGGGDLENFTAGYHEEVEEPRLNLLCDRLSIGMGLAERVQAIIDEEVEQQSDWEAARKLYIVLVDICKQRKNIKAYIWGLIFATGLDSANSVHSQAEIARSLGCTRALISHYTTEWADKLKIGVFKFRKAEAARDSYKLNAHRHTEDRKAWAWAKKSKQK